MSSQSPLIYLEQRKQTATVPVRLFAVVDGLLYGEMRGATPLERRAGSAIALFDATADASLAHAGPWLLDVEITHLGTQSGVHALAASPSGVSWLVSGYGLGSLADELRARLDTRLPDGRTALLRFYDARVIQELSSVLSFSQRIQFFAPVFDWMVQIEGALKRIHPHA